MKTTIVIPTYNEKDNIGHLVDRLLGLEIEGHELHVLVVDDNSPDGTNGVVERLAARDPRVKLMTRYKRRGRGFAGVDGFRAAAADGADFVIEMDADFSHDPKYIPALLARARDGFDIVIGSRRVKGGADADRGLLRRLITFLAGSYIRILLGLRVKDLSSGYRLFSRRAVEAIDLDNMFSPGPSILQEMLFKAVKRGMSVAEIPIVFVDRRDGVTKLNWVTLLEVLVMNLKLWDLNRRGALFPNA